MAGPCFLRFVGVYVWTCCVCTHWMYVYDVCRHSMVCVQVRVCIRGLYIDFNLNRCPYGCLSPNP